MCRARAACLLAPLLGMLGALGVGGCCNSAPHLNLQSIQANWKGPTTQSLSLPVFDADVVAVVDPPVGWKPDPLKASSTHAHKVWLSPTGLTAYGVIHFKMPLPVGQNLALSGFISQMKQSEGTGILISREDDPNLPGIRFVAEGGRYHIRANLIVSGWEGWAIYAGTLQNERILSDELDTAIRAREHTIIGRPDSAGK